MTHSAQDLSDLVTSIADLEAQLLEVEDPSFYEDLYIECMDEVGPISVAGYEYYPSKILAECDPIAYTCGLNNFTDSLITEAQEELQEELDDLQEELDELLAEEEDAV